MHGRKRTSGFSSKELTALSQAQRQLILLGGLAASALVVLMFSASLYAEVSAFNGSRLQRISALAEQFGRVFAERNGGYQRTATNTTTLWTNHQERLSEIGGRYVAELRGSDGFGRVRATTSDRAWAVYDLSSGQSTQLPAYLGLTIEGSSQVSSLRQERLAPGSAIAFAYDKRSGYLASLGLPEGDQLFSALGVSSALQASNKLSTFVQLNAGDARRTTRGGATFSSFIAKLPWNGEIALLGVTELSQKGTPYLVIVDVEPLDAVLRQTSLLQHPDIHLVDFQGRKLYSHNPASSVPTSILSDSSAKIRYSDGYFYAVAPLPSIGAALIDRYGPSTILSGIWRTAATLAALALALLSIIWVLLFRVYRKAVAPAMDRANRSLERERLNRLIVEQSPVASLLFRPLSGEVLASSPTLRALEAKGLVVADVAQVASKSPSIQYSMLATHAFVSTDGSRFEFEVRSAHASLDGAPLLLLTLIDVSSQKELQRNLERSRQVAEEASRAKSAFVSMVSHELRTPVSGVVGHLELLARETAGTGFADRVAKARRGADVLVRTVGETLDLSKIEAGMLEINQKPYRPLRAVEEVAELFEASAAEKGLTLLSEVEPGCETEVLGDSARVQQVLTNLVGNALKFTTSGFVLISVAMERDGSLRYAVTDSGPGLSAKEMKLIFEPFVQLDPALPGTGLGLFLSQRLAEVMGGSLTAFQPATGGAGFALSLPAVPLVNEPNTAIRKTIGKIHLVTSDEWPALEVERWLRHWGLPYELLSLQAVIDGGAERTGQGSIVITGSQSAQDLYRKGWPQRKLLALTYQGLGAPYDQVPSASLHDRYGWIQALEAASVNPVSVEGGTQKQPVVHILIVDDHPANIDLLGDQIRALGHSYEAATNGSQALTQWQPGRFQLVLTDLNMPVLDGYGLASSLRALGAQEPIIALTANAGEHERKRALAVGVSKILVKPVKIEELAELLGGETGHSGITSRTPGSVQDIVRKVVVNEWQQDRVTLCECIAQRDRAKLAVVTHRTTGALLIIQEAGAAAICQRLELASAGASWTELTQLAGEVRAQVDVALNSH